MPEDFTGAAILAALTPTENDVYAPNDAIARSIRAAHQPQNIPSSTNGEARQAFFRSKYRELTTPIPAELEHAYYLRFDALAKLLEGPSDGPGFQAQFLLFRLYHNLLGQRVGHTLLGHFSPLATEDAHGEHWRDFIDEHAPHLSEDEARNILLRPFAMLGGFISRIKPLPQEEAQQNGRIQHETHDGKAPPPYGERYRVESMSGLSQQADSLEDDQPYKIPWTDVKSVLKYIIQSGGLSGAEGRITAACFA